MSQVVVRNRVKVSRAKRNQLQEYVKRTQGSRGTVVALQRIRQERHRRELEYWFQGFRHKVAGHHHGVQADAPILANLIDASTKGYLKILDLPAWYTYDFPTTISCTVINARNHDSIMHASTIHARQCARIAVDQWCLQLIASSWQAQEQLEGKIGAVERINHYGSVWFIDGQWRRSVVEIAESLLAPYLAHLPRVLVRIVLDILFCSSFSILPNVLL